jgi:hypothetical protein
MATRDEIISYLAANVTTHTDSEYKFQRECTRILGQLPGGDEHPWNEYIDTQNGDRFYNKLCEEARRTHR